MNILILSRADHTGAGYALMQAINEHTEHKARAICYKRTWLKYPVDIFQPSLMLLSSFMNWADVVNSHSGAFIAPEWRNKPVVMTYHGSYYRNHRQELDKRDKLRGYKRFGLTLTLAMHGLRWIGRPIGDLSHMRDPADEFTVHHCSTHPKRKGTQQIVNALDGFNLDIVRQKSNAECLRRRARCHVVVDRFRDTIGTIGTTTIESFAMGLPVISWATPERMEYIESVIGYVPFVYADGAEQLREAAQRLRDDPVFYAACQRIGQRYVEEWHDPARIAGQFVELVNG